MKKQTIGRLFSLLMCATLAFTSVDLSALAANSDSSDTEIVTEVSEKDAEVTEDSDDIVVSDEEIIVTTEDVEDDSTNNSDENDDVIIVDDDDAENVFAASTGMTGCSTDFSNFTDYDSAYNEWFDGFKQSYTPEGGSTKYVYGVKYASNASTSNYRDFQPKASCSCLGAGCLSSVPEYNQEENRRSADVCAKNKTLLRSVVTKEKSELSAIQRDACRALDGLVYVDLTNSTYLNYIGSGAFIECPNLKYVLLPSNVKDIANDAFGANTIIVCPADSETFTTLQNANYTNIYVYSSIVTNPGTNGNCPTVTGPSLKTYILSVTKSGSGTINPGTTTYGVNKTANVSWTPGTGYYTSSVKVDGVAKTGTSISIGPMRSDHTVSVVFTPNTYKIYLYDNGFDLPGGGIKDPTTVNATYDSTVTLPTPTREGYTFKAWNTAADGSGSDFKSGSVYKTAGDTKLYAQWKSDEKEYSVDLDSVGGLCDVTSIKIITTQPCPTLPTPTKSGYSFMGWYTEKDGKGIQVKAGDKIVDIFNVLYAYYVEGSVPTPTPTPGPDDPTPTPSPEPTPTVSTGHSVTYILNGGVVPNKKASKLITDYEKSSTVLPKPKKTGYKFIGWFVGDVKVKKLGKNVSVCKGDIKVEARFALVDRTNKLAKETSGPCGITYVKNGGIEKAMLPTSYQGRAKIKLPKVSKDGYSFLGWFANVNGNLVKVSNVGYKCGICDGGKNITLTAMFTPNQYIIKFNKNGGKGKMDPIITYYDVNTLLPAATFEKGTMTVAQWLDKKNNTSYNVNSYVKNLAKKGSITLKANWILKVDNKTSYNSDNVSENLLNADEVSENSLN